MTVKDARVAPAVFRRAARIMAERGRCRQRKLRNWRGRVSYYGALFEATDYDSSTYVRAGTIADSLIQMYEPGFDGTYAYRWKDKRGRTPAEVARFFQWAADRIDDGTVSR